MFLIRLLRMIMRITSLWAVSPLRRMPAYLPTLGADYFRPTS